MCWGESACALLEHCNGDGGWACAACVLGFGLSVSAPPWWGRIDISPGRGCQIVGFTLVAVIWGGDGLDLR